MGLFDKCNTRATRWTVFAWAIGGGVFGGLVGFYGCSQSDMPNLAVYFIVPWMVAFCGVTGGAIEWQMPSESDDDTSSTQSHD